MDKLLNAADVANLLNLSTSTLAKMRLSGNTPKYIKMGWIHGSKRKASNQLQSTMIRMQPDKSMALLANG